MMKLHKWATTFSTWPIRVKLVVCPVQSNDSSEVEAEVQIRVQCLSAPLFIVNVNAFV